MDETMRRLLGVSVLAAMTCGCGGHHARQIEGTWNIREIPNDTWTFEKSGRFSVTADNAPYDKGS
jgi:hypothetical protein